MAASSPTSPVRSTTRWPIRSARCACPGISTYPEPRRFQPSENLAHSIIGATDPDGKGTAGLELAYNDLLTGKPGELVRERGQDGRTIPSGSTS